MKYLKKRWYNMKQFYDENKLKLSKIENLELKTLGKTR